MNLPRYHAWMDLAACTQVDPDWFFPNNGDTAAARRAREICSGCPVREQCAEFALANGEREGIWAGHNPRSLRRQRGAA